MGEIYEQAETELAGFFTSALGVAAQSYDGFGGKEHDTNDAHLRLRNDGYRRALQQHAQVECTLALVPFAIRETLRAVYEPHGWSGFLALAFPHRFGSFVGLAIKTDRARERCGKQTPRDWLEWQAGLGEKAPRSLFRAIAEECTERHRAALASYEPHRRARVEDAKKRHREAKVERENLFRETMGKRRSSRPPASGVVLVAEMLAELTGTGS